MGLFDTIETLYTVYGGKSLQEGKAIAKDGGYCAICQYGSSFNIDNQSYFCCTRRYAQLEFKDAFFRRVNCDVKSQDNVSIEITRYGETNETMSFNIDLNRPNYRSADLRLTNATLMNIFQNCMKIEQSAHSVCCKFKKGPNHIYYSGIRHYGVSKIIKVYR